MSHKLHDITLYYLDDAGDQSKRFTVLQNVVSALYVHFLECYKPPKTTRISIALKNPGEAFNQLHRSRSMVTGDVSFDKAAFWHASADDKKRMILDMIHSFAIRRAGEFGWDKTVFNRAYQRVLDANYIFKTESRPKLSPDRRLKAALMIEKNEGENSHSCEHLPFNRQEANYHLAFRIISKRDVLRSTGQKFQMVQQA